MWYVGKHKECAETSLKYEGVGSDIVTTNSENGGQGNDYYTDISYTYTYAYYFSNTHLTWGNCYLFI